MASNTRVGACTSTHGEIFLAAKREAGEIPTISMTGMTTLLSHEVRGSEVLKDRPRSRPR